MDSEGVSTFSDVEVDTETSEGEEDGEADAPLVAPEGRVVEDPTAKMTHPSYAAPEGGTRTTCVNDSTQRSHCVQYRFPIIHRWTRLGKGPPGTRGPRLECK